MIAVILSCGIATTLVFLINFYFPIMKELKIEFIESNINIKKIADYNWLFRVVYVAFAFVLNSVLFVPVMFIMFFQHASFKELLKERTKKRILANAEI